MVPDFSTLHLFFYSTLFSTLHLFYILHFSLRCTTSLRFTFFRPDICDAKISSAHLRLQYLLFYSLDANIFSATV